MGRISTSRMFETPSDGHYFFGYFNTPQVSGDDSKLLALKCDFIDRIPDKSDSAIIGYFDLGKENPAFQKIGTTKTFNWQQGCMLQFCGPDYLNKIIYNDFDGNKYVSVLADLETGSQTVFDYPIYTIASSGELALTLDFPRHYWCRRGYSYGNIIDQKKNNPIVEGDGIWAMDLKDGSAKKIIKIEDMLNLSHIGTMDEATHYLEHMTFNPGGTKFAFLHRWKFPEGGIHSRLCVADSDGKNIRILNDSGRMSHYCWRDENRLIGYGGISNSVNRLRKKRGIFRGLFKYLLPVYHFFIKDSSRIAQTLTGDTYMEIDVSNGKIERIAQTLRGEDGHPAFITNRDVFITDTYARSKLGQKAKLFAYDLTVKTEALLDELESIDKYDETPLRCDLHPRVSRSGNVLTVDTMERGVRGIYAYRTEDCT